MKQVRSIILLGVAIGFIARAGSSQTPRLDLPADYRVAPAVASVDGEPSDGLEMGAFASKDLGDREWQFVRSQLNKLPTRMKQRMLAADLDHYDIFFVDGATGEVHQNRPDLVGLLNMTPDDDPLPGDDYPFADAPDALRASDTKMPSPASSCGGSPFPGCYAGSGPYRRIFTPPVTGENECPNGPLPQTCANGNYSNQGYWNTGNVTTACLAGQFTHNGVDNDAGFSYLGGWSPSPGQAGGLIDAGLQYNYEIKKNVSKDDYALFIKIPGVGTAEISQSTTPPGGRVPPHIGCGPGYVLLEFDASPWILDFGQRPGCEKSTTVVLPAQLKECTTFALIAEQGPGQGQGHSGRAIVYLAPDVSFGGWGTYGTYTEQVINQAIGPGWHTVTVYIPEVPCPGCIFKWMTGIGQKTENLRDGSNYSATWSDRRIAAWAYGKSAPIDSDVLPMTKDLTDCSEYPLRSIYSSGSVKSDCSNSPLKGLTGNEGDVTVTNYSVTGETDKIVLP